MERSMFVKKVVAALLAMCLLCSMIPAAMAESDTPGQDTRAVTAIGVKSISAFLDINSSGRATCTGSVDVRDGYTMEVTMDLQQSKNGSTWTSKKSWTETGSGKIDLEKYYYVTSGYKYCVVVTVDVYNASNALVESISCESAIISY